MFRSMGCPKIMDRRLTRRDLGKAGENKKS